MYNHIQWAFNNPELVFKVTLLSRLAKDDIMVILTSQAVSEGGFHAATRNLAIENQS